MKLSEYFMTVDFVMLLSIAIGISLDFQIKT